ncbi:hypothetical protein [Bradyrhizobium sp. 191]|uniref:hypothetical protein n=1 Tax=Bradyrhizobium sp. 191 TaxID=2782659 RepID=UPI00200035A1|nr:hypothetical protein [Bradyrhizobium sp. 191]UPJ65246.1 hypothetical protein IVB23_35875 [Bradyrhizobium sp. 191]
MGWSARFDDPIPLPDGRELTTLLDAGNYITALPAKIQKRPEWQAATEVLLLVAERGGPTMMARIGMMRALHSEAPGTAMVKLPAKPLR